ncbi:MAG: response regulator [Roseburia sp.]|nr:response regulator [Ruminococcus sp.]MCM1155443.1 response regulator [Roseburia sp.]MCM1241909.1 response regulator [Roseburia sp.]
MALKVFLVEDESVVREGLRDNIPWQQFGYQFVGEAGDGEMALPLIRKTKPDVLITDIKMPFMDGLTLSHIVSQEFPEMKIIIISGYDDFEYAREAIKVGVDQYLLKPITRRTLQKALTEVKEKIESEQEQKNYLNKYQDDMHEYEQFFLRHFFEKVFAGELSVQEIYEEAQKHALNMDASCYNLVLIDVQGKSVRRSSGEVCQRCYEELMRFLMRFPNYYLVFRWSVNVYGIMIQGEEENINERTAKCLEGIEQICAQYEEEVNWYAAAGTPVGRFSLLADCYRKLNHIFNYRFFEPGRHIISEQEAESAASENGEDALEAVDMAKVNPELLKSFLARGQKEEVTEFVSNFLNGLGQALRSRIFWDYLLLNIRFATLSYIEGLGVTKQEFLEHVHTENIQKLEIGLENMQRYAGELLTQAIAFRDREYDTQGKKALKKALEYIEENYTRENLSLNEIAAIMEVTPNYFSAMFSQEMQMTFVEYVTQKRMEKARWLLQETEMRANEIALAVGYKNPHYFSFVFKKTQGCTPREYRA